MSVKQEKEAFTLYDFAEALEQSIADDKNKENDKKYDIYIQGILKPAFFLAYEEYKKVNPKSKSYLTKVFARWVMTNTRPHGYESLRYYVNQVRILNSVDTGVLSSRQHFIDERNNETCLLAVFDTYDSRTNAYLRANVLPFSKIYVSLSSWKIVHRIVNQN